MARVWDGSKQSGSALLMLLALADFSDDDGNAYPAIGRLATKCRCSKRYAMKLLTALEASGELEVRVNEGPHGVNRYRVLVGLEVNQSSPPKPRAQVNRSSLGECTPVHQGSEPQFTQEVNPSSPKPSTNHQGTIREPSRGSARARKPSKTLIPDGFGISPRVRSWAEANRVQNLEGHLEAFVSKARAKAYEYADWDEAFMGAVRSDWAGLRSDEIAAAKREASNAARDAEAKRLLFGDRHAERVGALNRMLGFEPWDGAA